MYSLHQNFANLLNDKKLFLRGETCGLMSVNKQIAYHIGIASGHNTSDVFVKINENTIYVIAFEKKKKTNNKFYFVFANMEMCTILLIYFYLIFIYRITTENANQFSINIESRGVFNVFFFFETNNIASIYLDNWFAWSYNCTWKSWCIWAKRCSAPSLPLHSEILRSKHAKMLYN